MATFKDNVIVTTADGKRVVLLDAFGDAVLGGNGQQGDLQLANAKGRRIVTISAETADLKIGGRGVGGDILLFPKEARPGDVAKSEATIRLDAQSGDARFGGHGSNGEIWLFPTEATDIDVDEQATIRLNGQAGDIEFRNADAAEDFDVSSGSLEPGDVMVLGDDGLLSLSERPYDRRVAGVVAGAGGCRPGIVLGRRPSETARVPIALAGRVYCKAEVADEPIAVGDLLTTSPVAGHAMRVTDHGRAFGAVIGKAMGRLESGSGLVPVLVALQ